jgi:peptide/nickel transport system substrate-binding protein
MIMRRKSVMKKKICVILTLALTLSLFAIGCGDTADNGASDTRGVILQINGDITSFDPFTWALDSDGVIHQQIYDTLIYINPDHSVEPRLAESYEVNEDSSVFTFKIREGVKFHNGDELKASDVVFSIEYYLESPFLSTFVGAIAGVEDIGNNTVQITMHEPNAAFLIYASDMLPIVSERAITEAGDSYDDAPVGTGPYMYVSYARADQIQLTRFDDYFRGPARIKDVTLRIIPNPSAAVIALQAGDIDFCMLMAADHANVSADPNLVVGEYPMQLFEYAILNHAAAPFDDLAVRQAAFHAIDREFILEATAEGLGVVASNLIPPGIFGYSADIALDFPYDPDRAVEILAQAGISTPMDIGTLITIEPFAMSAQIVQQNLEAVGLVAAIDVMEMTRFGESLALGDFAVACIQLGLTTDADSFSFLLTPEFIGIMNYASYNNPVMSDLFARGRATANLNERLSIYTELFNIAGNDVAYIPLIFPYSNWAWTAELNAPERVSLHVYDMYWS